MTQTRGDQMERSGQTPGFRPEGGGPGYAPDTEERAAPASERYWRRVPYINVLPSQRRSLPSHVVLRGVLVLVFFGLALLAFTEYRSWQDLEDQSETAQVQLQSLQRQLDVRRGEIEPLETEINLLTLAREEAEETYAAATSDSADWHAAMSALLSAETTGVEFRSATIDPDGRLALSGVATGGDAIAALPAQLASFSSVMELQGIVWDPASVPPSFTAEFEVVR